MPFAPLMAGFGEGHFQAKDWLGSYGLRVPFPPIEFVVYVSGFMVFLGTVGTVGNTHLYIIDATTMIMKIARI